jgi:hypothetical protein
VGFVVDKVALGQVFSEYFGFPCQSSFHRLLHTHHLSSGAGTIDQLVADVPSGLSLTPPQEIKKKKVIQNFTAGQLITNTILFAGDQVLLAHTEDNLHHSNQVKQYPPTI